MAGAAHQHLQPMLQERRQRLAQPHHPRRVAGIEDVEVEGYPHLQIGQPVKRLHERGRVHRTAPGFEHDPHLFRRLVANVRQHGRFPRLDERRDLLDQPRLLHLIGDLGHDDPVLAAALVFGFPSRPQPEAAAARGVGLDDVPGRLDENPAGGKIRAGHEFDQLLDARPGILDEMQQGIAQLADVVRRNARRHADGDPAGAVGQQVGKRRRQHHRLALLAVVGIPEIDRVLVDPVEQRFRHRGQPRLGVTHGGGVVAVDVAEIPLAVDERIARGERLGQTHERVVDRLIAVGVELADDVADDAGAFLEAPVGIEPELPHRVQQPAMDGLQAVAHVRQRPGGDGGERIREIPLAQGVRQGGVANVLGGWRNGHRTDISPYLVLRRENRSTSRTLAGGSAPLRSSRT